MHENVYAKEIVNEEEKSIIKWKYCEECRHVKCKEKYNKYLISKRKLEASGEPSHLYLERQWK